MSKSSIAGHLAAAGAYTIFGLNIVFCKDITMSGTISPLGIFTMRVGTAALLFWLISAFMPKEKMSRKDLGLTFLASIVGLFVPQVTFLEAMVISTSIDTAIISALGPIMTMIIAAIFLKEPITSKKAGGVVLSFAGIIFLILNSVHSGGAVSTKPLGVVLLLLNALSFASYLGIFKPLIARYSVVTFMKWMFLFSLAMTLPLSARSLACTAFAAMSVKVWSELVFVIVFSTCVAYFLVPYSQQRLRPTVISMYSYFQPIIATSVSIFMGVDFLNWQKCVAIVLVFCGVAIVNRSRAAGEPSKK